MGKKVIVSTHSTVPLEFVWAFNILKESNRKNKEADLLKLFDEKAKGKGMLDGIFEKTIKTYAFERKDNGQVVSVDISSLDAMDEQNIVSEWGGLSSFASRSTNLVSNYCDE